MSPGIYNFFIGLAVFVSVLFCALVFFTGKGDAMSGGGGSVRTTFKGKAGFDDQVSKLTLIIGGSFMGLMILLDIMAVYVFRGR